MTFTPDCGPNCGNAVPGFPLGQMVHDGDWHATKRQRRQDAAATTRGAEEVMDRACGLLIEAARNLDVDHPAAESVGRAVDYLAGWLGRRTVIIGRSNDG